MRLRAVIPVLSVMVLSQCSRPARLEQVAPLPTADRAAMEYELVAVVVTMAGCCKSVMEPMRSALDTLRETLSAQARTEGRTFRMVGLSLDVDPTEGWEHLRKLGSFDEVSVGGNWRSLAAETLIWSDTTVPPVVPQIVVYRQGVRMGDGTRSERIRFIRRETIKTVSGAPAMREWIAAGAPLR